MARKRHDAGMVAGFTLAELVAAVAIMVVIMMLMTRIFSGSMTAYNRGTRISDSDAAARAALDMIGRELMQAANDPLIGMKVTSGVTTVLGVGNGDQLEFVSLMQTPSWTNSDTCREAVQIKYYLADMLDMKSTTMPNRFRLVRGATEKFNATSYAAYSTNNWWTFTPWQNTKGNQTMAENVCCFKVWLYDASLTILPDTYNLASQRPLLADLYIELIGQNDAERIAAMESASAGAGRVEADRVARRLTKRVYFANRNGYRF